MCAYVCSYFLTFVCLWPLLQRLACLTILSVHIFYKASNLLLVGQNLGIQISSKNRFNNDNSVCGNGWKVPVPRTAQRFVISLPKKLSLASRTDKVESFVMFNSFNASFFYIAASSFKNVDPLLNTDSLVVVDNPAVGVVLNPLVDGNGSLLDNKVAEDWSMPGTKSEVGSLLKLS